MVECPSFEHDMFNCDCYNFVAYSNYVLLVEMYSNECVCTYTHECTKGIYVDIFHTSYTF